MSGLLSFTKLAFAAPRLTMVAGTNTLAARAYATKKIFIGNLPWRTSDEEIKDYLTRFGELKDFHSPKDFEGNTKGYAFIEVEEDIADKVLQEADGQEFNGRNLRVNIADPRPPRREREGEEGGFRREGGYRREGGEGGFRRNFDNRRGGDYERRDNYRRRDDYGGRRDNRRGDNSFDRPPRRSDDDQ